MFQRGSAVLPTNSRNELPAGSSTRSVNGGTGSASSTAPSCAWCTTVPPSSAPGPSASAAASVSTARRRSRSAWILSCAAGSTCRRTGWSPARSAITSRSRPSTVVSCPRPAGGSVSSNSGRISVAVALLTSCRFRSPRVLMRAVYTVPSAAAPSAPKKRRARTRSGRTSDLAGGLDLVVLGAAVLAPEGRDDDLTEVGDACEQEPGHALLCARVSRACMRLHRRVE
jgi:hypothetical protein